MARRPRVEFEGAIYHVTARIVGERAGGGVEGRNPKQWLFRDEQDHKAFMDRLIDRVGTYNIRLYAHCEMRTHYHALLGTPQANLGRFPPERRTGMHSLNTAYTAFYNTRHRRHGHLFQGRYGAKPVDGDAYLLSLSRYIHLNPVHVKRVQALSFEEQLRHLHLYHWSSYRAYSGRAKIPDWLEPGPVLASCGRSRRAQREQYRAFVEGSLAEEDEALLDMLKGPSLAIGDAGFVDDIRSRTIELIGEYKREEDVSLRHVLVRLDAETVLAVAGEVMQAEPSDFQVRRRNSVLRGIGARMLCKYAGLTQREAAGVLRIGSGAAVSWQQQKLNDKLLSDRRLMRRVNEIETRLTALSQP